MTPILIFSIFIPVGILMLLLAGKTGWPNPVPEEEDEDILEEASENPEDEAAQITDIDPDAPHTITEAVAGTQTQLAVTPGQTAQGKKSPDVPMNTAEKLRKLAEEKDRELRSGRQPVRRSIAS